jgi:hypothetical protein
MPLERETPAFSRLLELVRQTTRYSICEVEPGQFEVIDNRYLLDHLLRFPELRPTTNDWIEIEFDEALEALSSGPTLSLDDHAMLGWLTTTVEVLDPTEKNAAYVGAYAGAVVLRGTFRQVEYFLLAALSHRVQ